MKYLTFIFLLFSQQIPDYNPQTGDLLFQDIDCGPLCDAIEQVTVGVNGARFSHVGVFVKKDSGDYVLEAVSSGVKYTPYADFLSRSYDSSGNPKVIAGRLKKQYRTKIGEAIEAMEKYLDKPYDNEFDLQNDAYYCSELIYFGFRAVTTEADFFELNPMTFKSPGDSSFFSVWKDYFNSMNIKIPENEPGLNPGSISRSEKLEIVHVFGYPDGYNP